MEINIRTKTNDNAKTTTASILFPITEELITEGRK
jgi:hypothetical protein